MALNFEHTNLIGRAVVLRDYCDNIEYLNDEHKMLADIADALQNVLPKDLTPEAQTIYLGYSAYFWRDILERIGIDKAVLDAHHNGFADMTTWGKDKELERYCEDLEYFKKQIK